MGREWRWGKGGLNFKDDVLRLQGNVNDKDFFFAYFCFVFTFFVVV